jgi:hypothetical protein
VDRFAGVDPTGVTDSTGAVELAIASLEAIATARGATNLGKLVFGPGQYKFGGILVGTRSLIVEGVGPEMTILLPRSTAETMMTWGSTTGYSAYGNALLNCTLRLPGDMAYTVPVTLWRLTKGWRIENVFLDGTSAGFGGYTGKFIKMYSSYEGKFINVHGLRGKYCVPVDLDPSMVNPGNSGIVDQCDTIHFEHWVNLMCAGPIYRGAVPGQSGGDSHGLHFDDFKSVLLSYDNAHVPNYSTTLLSTATAGATEIHCALGEASPAGIRGSEMITIGANYNLEVAKVVSVNLETNIATLAKPLEYTHDITDVTNFPHGVPVIVGGFGISLGHNIQTVSFKNVHSERQYAFFLLGRVSDIEIDAVYMGASYLIFFMDATKGTKVGATWMSGTTVENRLLNIPDFRTGAGPGDIRLLGPFTENASAAKAMVVAPPSPGNGFLGFEVNELPSGSRGPINRRSSYLATDTTVARVVQRQNEAGDAYSPTVQETYSGQVYHRDGTATKWLGAIDGKTNAEIDALFEGAPGSLPSTVALIASGTVGGEVVTLSRKGGAENGWQIATPASGDGNGPFYPAVAQEIFPILLANGNSASPNALVTEKTVFSYFTARANLLIASIITLSGGTAASGLTVGEVGLYEVLGNGNLVRVAKSANTITLWGSASSIYSPALESAYEQKIGKRYAVGCMATGTTMPRLLGLTASLAMISASHLPRVLASVSGTNASLPAEVASGSLTASSGVNWAAVHA